MNKEKGIILNDGRLITTFEELEGEFLKISADYEFLKTNLEFTDNACRKAKEEIVRLQTELEEEARKSSIEILWLKQMNKSLVELSIEVLRNKQSESEEVE